MKSAIRTFPASAALAFVALTLTLSGNTNAAVSQALPDHITQQRHLSPPPRPRVHLPPGLLLPRRYYQHQTPLVPPRPSHICDGPDLALEAVWLVFSHVYNPDEPFDPRWPRYHVVYSIEAVVKNVGRQDWRSGANQQQVNIDFYPIITGFSRPHYKHFPQFLSAGASVRTSIYGPISVGWSDTLTRPIGDYHVYLTYAPHINQDGNPANDDCNLHNQSIELSVQQIRRAILSRRTVVTFHR